MGRVVVGMDPHKRSATIEVIDAHERVLAAGRFGTGKAGYAEMLAVGREYPDRVWAVEGCEVPEGTSHTGWCMTGRRWWMCRLGRVTLPLDVHDQL